MAERKREANQLVINYLFLRKTVGWVGTLLPIILIAGNAHVLHDQLAWLDERVLLHAHAQRLRRCALRAGCLPIAYAGYDDWDRWITNVAGVGVIGVAFCATKPRSVRRAHARARPRPCAR